MKLDKIYKALAWVFAAALLLLLVKVLCFLPAAPAPYMQLAAIPQGSWAARLIVRDDSLPPAHLLDSSRSNVFVFLDSWGVPVSEPAGQKISGIRPQKLSRASFAESHWLPGLVAQALAFDLDTCHYKREGADSTSLKALDSLLARPGKRLIIWTATDLRGHLSDSAEYFRALNAELNLLAAFASRHLDVRFIVQGNHEPTLAPRTVRSLFYRHYAPFVVLN